MYLLLLLRKGQKKCPQQTRLPAQWDLYDAGQALLQSCTLRKQMTTRLDTAHALGFSSTASMDEHQAWLAKLRVHTNLVRTAVIQSETPGV